MSWERGKFAFFVLLFQVILLILFILYGKYDLEADASYRPNSLNANKNGIEPSSNSIEKYFIYHQVATLIILLAFNNLFNYSDLTLTDFPTISLLFYSLTFQWTLVSMHLIRKDFDLNLNVIKFVQSQKKCLAVALSFAVLYGKVSLTQLLIMIVLQVPILCICSLILNEKLLISDVGSCHEVYLFGTLFGLGIALTQRKQVRQQKCKDHLPVGETAFNFRVQSIMILISSLVILFTIDQEGDKKHRVLINTLFCMCGSISASFACSSFFDTNNLPNPNHIQVGITSGLVSMTAIANLMISPAIAIIIGLFAAAVSIVSKEKLQPFLLEQLSLHDTFAVLSSFTCPAVLSSLTAVCLAGLASETNYDYSLYDIYPIRTPLKGTEEFEQLITYSKPERAGGTGRSASIQSLMQALALLVTILISLIGGLIVGYILKSKFFSPLPKFVFTKEIKTYVLDSQVIRDSPTMDSIKSSARFKSSPKHLNPNDLNKSELYSYNQDNVRASSSTNSFCLNSSKCEDSSSNCLDMN